MSIALVGWLVAMAGLSWLAYDEGYTSLLLPIWNSVFVLGMVPIVQGVFARRLWGQRWVVGISVFTAIGNAWQASRMDSSLLWFGAALLVAVAIVVKSAKALFNDSDGNRGRVQQTIATIVTIGSVVVSLQTMQGGGTERGRASFAREVQQSYEQAAPGAVRVSVDERVLVIESKGDTDAQIDGAADQMHAQLATAGRRAKAWVLGFKHIVITNGSHKRTLSPDNAP
ncbi:MAG TPA: hypothetical protein VIV11_05810 [Kofleriaceae bacterium]